jgi:hypothetical protein
MAIAIEDLLLQLALLGEAMMTPLERLLVILPGQGQELVKIGL